MTKNMGERERMLLSKTIANMMPVIGEKDSNYLTGDLGRSEPSDSQLVRWRTADINVRAGGVFVTKGFTEHGKRPILPGTTPSLCRSVASSKKAARKLKHLSTSNESNQSDAADPLAVGQCDKLTQLSNKMINKLPLNLQEDIRALVQMILERCSQLEAKSQTINQKFLSQEKERLKWIGVAEEREHKLLLAQKEAQHLEQKVSGLSADMAKFQAVTNKQRHALDRLGARNANLGDIVAALVDPPEAHVGIGSGSPVDFRASTSQKFQSLLQEGAVNQYAGVTHQRRRIQSSMSALNKEKDDLTRLLKNTEDKASNYKRKAKQAQQKMRQMQGELEEAKTMLEALGDVGDSVVTEGAKLEGGFTNNDKSTGANTQTKIKKEGTPTATVSNQGSRVPKPRQLKLERSLSGFQTLKGIQERMSSLLTNSNYDMMEVVQDFEEVMTVCLALAGSESVEAMASCILANRCLRLFGANVMAIFIAMHSRQDQLGVQTSRSKEVFFVPSGRGVVGRVLSENQVVRMVNPRLPAGYDPEVDASPFGTETSSPRNQPPRAMMALPILDPHSDQAIGVLQFYKRDISEFFTEVDEILGSILCTQIGASLLHTQTEARLLYRESVMTKIFLLGAQLMAEATPNPDFEDSTTPDMIKAVRCVERMALEVLKGRAARLFIVSHDRKSLWHIVQEINEKQGFRTTYEPKFSDMSQGLCGATAETGNAVFLQQPYETAELNSEMDLETSGRPLTCVPIKNFHNNIIAVLQVSSYFSNVYSSHPFLDMGDLRKNPFELEAAQWFAIQIAEPLHYLLNQTVSSKHPNEESMSLQLRMNYDALRKDKQILLQEISELKTTVQNLQLELTNRSLSRAESREGHIKENQLGSDQIVVLQDQLNLESREKQRAIEELKKTQKSKMEMLESNMKLIDDLQKQIRSKEDALFNMKQINSSLEAEKKAVDSQAQVMLEQVSALEHTLLQERNIAEKMKTSFELQINQKIEEMSKSQALLLQELEGEKKTIQDLKFGNENQAHAFDEKIKSVSESIKSQLQAEHQDKIAELRAQFEEETLSLQTKLLAQEEKYAAGKSTLDSQILQLEEKLAEVEAGKDCLQEDFDTLQSQNKTLLSAAKDNENQIAQLEEKLAEVEAEKESLQEELVALRRKSSLRRKSKGNDAEQDSTAEQQVVLEELEKSQKMLKEANRLAATQKKDMQKQEELIKLLQEELASCKAEIKLAQASCTAIQKQLQLEEEKNNAIEDSHRVSDQSEEISKLNEIVTKEQQIVSEQKLLIEKLSKELEDKNLHIQADQKLAEQDSAALLLTMQEQKVTIEKLKGQLEQQKLTYDQEIQLLSQKENSSSNVCELNEQKQEIERLTQEILEQKTLFEKKKKEIEQQNDEKLLQLQKAIEAEKEQLKAEQLLLKQQKEAYEAALNHPTSGFAQGVDSSDVYGTEEENNEADYGDWVEQSDEEGNVYYYNQVTGETQWDKPNQYAGLGADQGEWIKQLHNDGTEYYLNTATGETSWENPSDIEELEDQDQKEVKTDKQLKERSYSIEL